MDRQLLRPGPIPALALALAALVAACGVSPESETAPPGEPAIVITAEGLQFRPARLEVPANTALNIILRNRDEGVPHGILVATRTSGVEPTQIGQSEIVTGPADLEFSIPPLAAFPYLFSCPVHPTMQVEVDAR
jgi:hypothetical protein